MSAHGKCRELQAKDIMQTKIICVTPTMSLNEARDLFARQRISGAPVVHEGELVGVISLSDIARVGLAKDFDDFPENSFFIGLPPLYGGELSSLGKQLEERTVDDAMSQTVYTVSPDDQLSTVAVKMRQQRIHRLIVTEGKRVVGIISSLDMIQVLEDH